MTADAPEREDEASVVAVTVVRTGGMAGVRRRWHVEPAADDEERWISLIDECPWEAVVDETPGGADRFVWAIQARCGERREEATLPDREATGPWRDLIDEVRAPRADVPSGVAPEPH